MNLKLPPILMGAAFAAVLAVSAGCQRSTAGQATAAAPQPPEIPIVRAEAQTAPDALTFSGRIEAMHRVELRPRVTGPLTAVHYREGDVVRAGTALFEIDPRPYRARRDQHAAEFARATAALVLARQDLARARRLRETDAIAPEELERRAAEAAGAEASRDAAQAALAAAALDLEFTTVRAPVDGRAGRALVTPGNVATANDTVLTTLVSVDSMRVRFAIDEAALHRLRSARAAAVALSVTGDAREFTGQVEYIAPTVDSATGTAEVRAALTVNNGVLLDGMFARVQLLLPADGSRVLVPETAVGAEQGSRYVLIADADNKLVHRRVTLGSRFGNLRAIAAGVEPGEAVVTAGLQFLRPGMLIRPVPPVSKSIAQADIINR